MQPQPVGGAASQVVSDHRGTKDHMKGDQYWSDLRSGAVTSTAPSDDLGFLNQSLGETQSEPIIDDRTRVT